MGEEVRRPEDVVSAFCGCGTFGVIEHWHPVVIGPFTAESEVAGMNSGSS